MGKLLTGYVTCRLTIKWTPTLVSLVINYNKIREDLIAGVQYVPEIWVGWGDGINWNGGRGQDVSGNRK